MVGARAGLISKMLSYLGILFGIVLITGDWLPGIVPPILTFVWSVWLGIGLLRGEPRVIPAGSPAAGVNLRTG